MSGCYPKADEDAKYFAELAGKATVIAHNKTGSRPTMLPWVTSGNRGQSEASRDLITPDELRRLERKVLLICGARKPLLVDQKPWYEDPKLAALVPNPKRYDALVEPSRARRGDLPLEPLPAAQAAPQDKVQPGKVPVVSSASAVKGREHAANGNDNGGTLLRSDGTKAHSGGACGSPGKPTHVVSAASGGTPPGTEGAAQRVGHRSGSPAGLALTDEERRLLGEVAKGLSPKKIAMRHGCDEERVRRHVGALCARLGVEGPAQAVLAARTLGLLGQEHHGREM